MHCCFRYGHVDHRGGRLAGHRDQNNNLTSYGYGNLGLLTSRTDAPTHVESRAYAGMLAQVTAGQMTSITDANNHTTTFTYSGPDLVQVTDALGRSTNYSSDAVGRLTFITDPLGGVTRLDYDGKDRLTKRTEPNGSTITNPVGALTKLEFRGAGHPSVSPVFQS